MLDMLNIKIFIKKHFSFVYRCVRKILLPGYVYVRGLKLKRFTGEMEYPFKYADVSFQIVLNAQNGFIDNEIYWKGVYEEDILLFLKTQLKKGDAYVDIGANIGQHALFASQLVGLTGRVYAFEPNINIYEQFNKSIRASNIQNIQLYNFGLANKDEQLTLHINPINKGGSSLVAYAENMEKMSVTIKNGDVVLKDVPRVDFVKIDVEGYEADVLEGLSELISRCRPKILLEFTPIFYNKKNENDGLRILNFLIDKKYSVRDLEGESPDKILSSKEELYQWFNDLKKDQTNIFCS